MLASTIHRVPFSVAMGGKSLSSGFSVQTFAMSTATTLPAGEYLFATTASTGGFRVYASSSAGISYWPLTTSTSASSGVLPSTITLSPSAAYQSTNVFTPVMIIT